MDIMKLEHFLPTHYDQLINWIDSEDLNALWGATTFKFPLTQGQIQVHCARDRVIPFIFTINGQAAGYVDLYKVSDSEYRICRVFISPFFRGKNYSTKMLQLVILKAKECKCELLHLNVFSHNLAAVSCYKKLGFTSFIVEVKDRIYTDRNWELIEMKKQI